MSNFQPVAAEFNQDGTLVKMWGPNSQVAFDPSSVAITGGVIGGVPIRPYIGIVASRGGCPSGRLAGNVQLMARSKHVAKEDIASLQLVYANWYSTLPSPFEYNAGAAAAYTASIEYPAGIIAAVATFGGSALGAVADGGLLVSDAVAVSIPRGAAFYVRTWQNNSNGVLTFNEQGLNNVTGAVPNSGEWVTWGVTQTDLTQSATNSNNQAIGRHFRPAAIIGWTRHPTFYLAGDSRLGQGTPYDTLPNSLGARGEVERSLVKGWATFNAGCTGETLANAISANYSKRIQLAQYCSHVICEYGINDIAAGTSLATMLANLKTFAGLFGNKPFFQTTVTPISDTTDGYATTTNQTIHNAGTNAVRVSYNNAIRQGLVAPITGCIEVADQVESARDSGIWRAAGRTVADAAITSGLNTLTSATAAFTASDVGKAVWVAGAGSAGAALATTITAFTNATTVTVGSAAGGAVTGAAASIGAYTVDGTHGSAAGNALIETSTAFQNIETA